MAKSNIEVEIKCDWYLIYIYLPSLSLFQKISNYIGIETNPNFDLISYTISKHTKIRIKDNV